MSDWALYSDYSGDPRYMNDSTNWTHPITVNIYSNHLDSISGVPDQLLATATKSVTIPWRPAADPTCPGGTAWRASDTNCYNGFAFNATFDFSAANVVLPSQVIVGVAYNTADHGASPIHQAGPYNSLNVGIPEGQTASVGSDVNSDAVFWDTTYPGYTAGFREDTGWAPNGTVAFKITTAGQYTFTGFGPPVNNNGVENIAVAGQSIPLKFRVTDNGVPVTNLTSADVSVTADSLSCAGLGTTADQIEEYASGGSGLINQGDGYYQFNWKTPKSYAKSCKTLSVNVGDGIDHTAIFRFTK